MREMPIELLVWWKLQRATRGTIMRMALRCSWFRPTFTMLSDTLVDRLSSDTAVKEIDNVS
jgi:hypothetical protein